MATIDSVQSTTSRMKKQRVGDPEWLKKVNDANEFGTIGLPEHIVSSKFTDIPELGSGDPNQQSRDVDQFQHNLSSGDTIVLEQESEYNENNYKHNEDNTQYVVIVRQNTSERDMDMQDDNGDNNQQQSSTDDAKEESSYSDILTRDTSNQISSSGSSYVNFSQEDQIQMVKRILTQFVGKDSQNARPEQMGLSSCFIHFPSIILFFS